MDDTLYEKYADAAETGLGLYYCGYRDRTPNHVYGPEIRTHFLLVLVEAGSAKLDAPGGSIPFGAGQMLTMFPGERIAYRAETPWSIRWIGVNGSAPESALAAIGVTRSHPICRPSRFRTLCRICTELYQIQYDGALRTQYRVQTLLHCFFAELMADERPAPRPDPVEVAVRMIRYNLAGDLRVETLAESVFLDESYFGRMFRARMGMSPKAYIRQQRMAAAKTMLRTTDRQIQTVAAAVGYSDPLYFSRVFQQAEGISPTAFRAKYQNQDPSVGHP